LAVLDLLTVLQAAELLAVREATVRAWIWRKQIPYVKVGGRAVRIRRDVVEGLIERGTVEPRSPPGDLSTKPRGRDDEAQNCA